MIPKAKEEWWPRLLKSSNKVHWIKADFDKWVDEDEAMEEAASGDNPFAQYMNMDGMDGMNMGGLNMDGMNFKMPGGIGGDLGDVTDEEEKEGSDTEEVPGHNDQPSTSASLE
jgi:hypothetical protein